MIIEEKKITSNEPSTEELLRAKGRLRHISELREEDKVPGEERLRQMVGIFPPGLEPIQAMKVLGTYFQTLETTFAEYKKYVTLERHQLEGEYRSLNKNKDDLKYELDRLTSDLLELTNTFEEQESLLSTINQKVVNYEKQLKKLYRENGELSNKLTQKENDAIFYRQELERCMHENETITSVLAAANARIEELERQLSAECENTVLHEKETRRLGLTLSESQKKNAITERKMEEIVVKYNDELKRLNDRTNIDTHHEITLLRKRIRSSVIPEMREFQQLINSKPSIETASNFKALLMRLVTKLEQSAGLDLK